MIIPYRYINAVLAGIRRFKDFLTYLATPRVPLKKKKLLTLAPLEENEGEEMENSRKKKPTALALDEDTEGNEEDFKLLAFASQPPTQVYTKRKHTKVGAVKKKKIEKPQSFLVLSVYSPLSSGRINS